MKEFLHYLLSLICDYPEKIDIKESQISDSNFSYLITADQSDIGKIIGKGGKIIQAVRNIAKIIAVKENIKIRIDVV